LSGSVLSILFTMLSTVEFSDTFWTTYPIVLLFCPPSVCAVSIKGYRIVLNGSQDSFLVAIPCILGQMHKYILSFGIMLRSVPLPVGRGHRRPLIESSADTQRRTV
jgi:hypothetical protein